MTVEYCVTCKHADFAHNGESHANAPKACDLCQKCKEFKPVTQVPVVLHN